MLVRRCGRNGCKVRLIHDYIESLPDKYDTIVDDDQNIFSIKRWFPIARTLLTDPQVLDLDEATSNVDTVTERSVQAMEAIGWPTSFVIAHRLKTILNADQIIVLKMEKWLSKGPSTLQLGGFYPEPYHNQFLSSWAKNWFIFYKLAWIISFGSFS